VELDPTAGHEQRGVRPGVAISDPDVIGDQGDQRFPLVCTLHRLKPCRSLSMVLQ
jgi:hypothetical protein